MRYCPLSQRQRVLYEHLRNKIRMEDLSSVINSSTTTSSSSSIQNNPLGIAQPAAAHLINLVMQLRKICNHPDLWERRDVRFACIAGGVEPSSLAASTSSCNLPPRRRTAGTGVRQWNLPRLLYHEGSLSVCVCVSVALMAQIRTVPTPLAPECHWGRCS